jgi:hypothetical protein
MAAGAASRIALLFLEKSEADISVLFVAHAAFRFSVAIAFAWVVVKFGTLIRYKPRALKGIVHANFIGSMIFATIYLLGGTQLNYLGLIISVLIYGYLLKSVDRISKEVQAMQTAEQLIAQSSAAMPSSSEAG